MVSWNPMCGIRPDVADMAKYGKECQRKCWVFPANKTAYGQSRAGSIIFHISEMEGNRMVLCDEMDIVRFIEMILILLLNITLFFFILSNRKLRGNKANKFFLNLQLVHIILNMYGIVSLLLPMKPLYEEIVINNGLLMEMFFSLVIATCDRYFSIEYPYIYQTLSTRKTLVIISCSWILPVSFVAIALYFGVSQLQLTAVSTIIIGISIIILTLSNVKLYLIARRSAMTLMKNKNSKVLKSTYVCFLLVTSFIIFWFPYFVHDMLAMIGTYKVDNNKVFTRVVVLVALLNSLLDPIFFVLFRRDVKKELKKLRKHRRHLTFQKKRDNQEHDGANYTSSLQTESTSFMHDTKLSTSCA